MPFFVALETEIEKAALAYRSVIIEMDANAKLGKKYIRETHMKYHQMVKSLHKLWKGIT